MYPFTHLPGRKAFSIKIAVIINTGARYPQIFDMSA
jgi:hypothetical protein